MPGYDPNHPVNRGREPADYRCTGLEIVLAVLATMFGGWFLSALVIAFGRMVADIATAWWGCGAC